MDTSDASKILVDYHKLDDDDQGDWVSLQFIKKGGYASVWLEGNRHDSTKTRAVKQVARRASTSQYHYEELVALVRFSRPKYEKHFAQCLGWYEKASGTETVIYMTMEYFKLGDLRKHMTPQRPFPEVECRTIIKQLLDGLRVMHDERVSHRDIKPENIFVVNAAPDWRIKIGDFGISKRARKSEMKHSTLRGTLLYMAPEIFSHSNYTNAVDIWAAGVLTFELLTGLQLFGGGYSVQHPLPALESLRKTLQMNGASLDSLSVVQELLSIDPSLRPTASEALSRDWFSLLLPCGEHKVQGYQRSDSPNIPTLKGVNKPEWTSSRQSFVSEELASWNTTVRTKTQIQAQNQAQTLRPVLLTRNESVYNMSALPRPATNLSLEQPQCRPIGSPHAHMDTIEVTKVGDKVNMRQDNAARSMVEIQGEVMAGHSISSLQAPEPDGGSPLIEGYLLYEAIAAKDLRQVHRLMNQGHPSNFLMCLPRKPWIRTTPLTAAISVGAFDIAVVLLENKADPNGRCRAGLISQEVQAQPPLIRLCEDTPWSREAIQMASLLVAHGAKADLSHFKVTFDRLDNKLRRDKHRCRKTDWEYLGMLNALHGSWSYLDLPRMSCDMIILLCHTYRENLPDVLLMDWLTAHIGIAIAYLHHVVHTVMGLAMPKRLKCEWLKELSRMSDTNAVKEAILSAKCTSETFRSNILRSMAGIPEKRSKQASWMDIILHYASSIEKRSLPR